jgi:hypothetical protein
VASIGLENNAVSPVPLISDVLQVASVITLTSKFIVKVPAS